MPSERWEWAAGVGADEKGGRSAKSCTNREYLEPRALHKRPNASNAPFVLSIRDVPSLTGTS